VNEANQQKLSLYQYNESLNQQITQFTVDLV